MQSKTILIGHVGRDPEITPLRGGGKVASFSLATSERWRDKATGERKERTEWHRVVVFAEPLIEVVEKYVGKGAKLYVEGQNATRKWKDNAGIERAVTEVVLRPWRGQLVLLDRAEGRAPPPGGEDAYGGDAPAETGRTYAEELDDEIPF